MQIVIDRNNLLDWLSVVEKAIPGKTSFVPVEGVYMGVGSNSLTLCANDLELAIRLFTKDIEGDGDGATVLPKRFVQIAKQLPGKEVKITVKDDRAVIESGSSKFKLNCVDAESFPLIDESYTSKPFFEIEGQVLKEMITKTTFCVAGINASPVFQGVYMSNGDGILTCMASDTYRLAWHRRLEVSSQEQFEILVPGRLLAEMGRIVEDNDSVKVYIAGNEIVFVVNDYTISARLLNGKYPDLEKAFPATANTGIKIDRQLLIGTVGRARILANKQNEMISLSIDGSALTVSSQGEVGEMREELSANVEGETLEQLFINAKYFLEGVKVFDNDELHINFHGETGAVVINEKDFRYLVLPIKPN